MVRVCDSLSSGGFRMNPSSGNKISAALGRGARPPVLRAAVFGLAYFALARLSFSVSGTEDNILSCWLPSGLFLGALLLTERRHWLGLILAGGLGDLAYNFSGLSPWPLRYLLLAHLGNSASAVLGAWLVRRFVVERPSLESAREFIGLLVFGGLLSLPLTATIGTLATKAVDPQVDWLLIWGHWYSSDLLGVLLLAPVLLAWRESVRWPATWRLPPRFAEAVGLCLGTVATLCAAFYFQWPQLILPLFLAIPYVLWASFRFGVRGASGLVLISLLVAQWFIDRGYGMAGGSALTAVARNVEMLVYIGGFSVIGLFPAIVLAEQRRSEAALREKDRVYRALVENINQGYYMADRRSRFLFCNPAMHAISGYRSDELAGISCFRLVAEEDRDRVINSYRKWIHDPSVVDVQCEFRAVTASGRKFWVEQSTHFQRDAEGRVVEGCNVLRDITARQEAEAALRESEERGRLVALATQDCIWDWDFTAEQGWQNEAYCRFLGLTPEEGVVRSYAPWMAHLHPDDAARVDTSLRTAIAGRDNTWACDYRIRRTDGTYAEVHARAYILRGTTGRPQRMIGAMRDVTERLQTAAKLQSSESRLRAIIDHEPECVKLVDPDGLLLEMNPAGLMMIEADSLDQVKNQSVYGLIAAEHRPAFRALHEKILRGDSGVLEFDITGLKGTRRTLETHATPLRDAAGTITAMLGVTRDITARKQAEEARRRSEEKFAALIHSVDGIVWEADAATLRFTFVSPRAERLLGYPTTRWTDEPAFWVDHIHPDDREHASRYCRQCTREKRDHEFEYRMLAVDGRAVWLRDIVTVVVEHDRPVKLRGIMVDITAHKAAEALIREQAGLLNQTRDAIMVADLGDRFTFWNEGAERITGWPAAETLGQTAELVLGPVDAAQLAVIRTAVMTTGAWHGELPVRHKDGRLVTLDLRVALVRDAAGRPKGRLSIATDITEKKQLEEHLLRVQRLESLGMLAAGIAHDLNNILSPVLMAAPLLRHRAMRPEDLRILDAIEKSAQRGGALVQQILSFARGHGTEMTLLQPKHVLREVVDLITDTFPKSIRVELELPEPLDPVRANPTQIHQALLNLCINARDAMSAGGILTLRAGNRPAEGRPGVFIEVADTGSGMSPEILARIWEPFFTTKGEGRGTGLGLATVRDIVRGHQGTIAVESTPGRGSTFRLWLPATAETRPRSAPPVSSHPPVAGAGQLLLVVDDDAQVRQTLGRLLTHASYRVLAAGSGDELRRLHAARLPEADLILMDLDLPSEDGLSLARALQQTQPAQRILFTTGSTGLGGFVVRSLPPGAPLLLKPFTEEELLGAVQAALAAPPFAL